MAVAEQQPTRHRNCARWINKRVQPGWASGAEGMAMMIKVLLDPKRPARRVYPLNGFRERKAAISSSS
jgi:hypothetical protein